MKIIHIISGLPKSAGTTTFVENVVREQRALGHTVDICTNANQDEKFHHSSFLLPPSKFAVVHIHGLWSMLLHKAAQYARHRNTPVIWSTHGMTAPWSLHHKWWKKCLPWYLYQRPDLKRAALIHCTTDLEADWNHALGLTSTFIAPLGTTLPRERLRLKVEVDNGVKTLLYVGRVYPVKALDNAIRAVALMKQPIKLRIVGPDQAGHMTELMSLCDQLHLLYATPENSPCSPRSTRLNNPSPSPPLHGYSQSAQSVVQFVGPKYDTDLSAEYDSCDGLILVSHTENFGATVVDALAHAKPVITSTKTPWKIVADKNCGYWVDNSPETLAKTFDEFASTSTSDLNLLGQNGRALVESEYTWPAIARNLITQYERIIRHD